MSKKTDRNVGSKRDDNDFEVMRSGSKTNDIQALKSLFKIALETRDFEISQLVQRNNFFMIFQGVLFAGVMQSSHTKPLVSFLVCFAGLIVSICQIGMASGAKFWQEYWEEALKEVEKKLLLELCGPMAQRGLLLALFHDDREVYQKIVRRRLSGHGKSFLSISSWLIMKQYSVSRIPIYVGIMLSVVWLIMISAMIDFKIQGFSFHIVGF